MVIGGELIAEGPDSVISLIELFAGCFNSLSQSFVLGRQLVNLQPSL